MNHPDTYLVLFEVPYSFRLNDSLMFEEEGPRDEAEMEKGNENLIGETFPILIDEIPAELAFRKRSSIDGMEFGGPGYSAPRDRLGNIIHTQVAVRYEKPFIDQIPQHIERETGDVIYGSKLEGLDKYLVGETTKYFNQFLVAYRIVTESYWLRPLLAEDISSFNILAMNSGEIEDKWSVRKSGGGLKGGNISKTEEQIIRNVLIQEADPPLEDQLKLQAEDQIDLGQFDLAIISVERWYETALRERFMQVKRARGSSPTEALKRIKEPDGEYVDLKNLLEIIASDLNFEYQPLHIYKQYYLNCRGLRNKVVHEGYTATEEDAMYASLCAQQALESFEAAFIPELRRWDILWDFLMEP